MIKKILVLFCFVTVWGCMGMESITDDSAKKSDELAVCTNSTADSMDISADANIPDSKKRKAQAGDQAKNNKKKKRKVLDSEPKDDTQDTSQAQIGWSDLPAEVIAHIVAHVCTLSSPIEALKELKKLELVSRELRGHAKDKSVLSWVMADAVKELKRKSARRMVRNVAYCGDMQSVETLATSGVDLAKLDRFGCSALLKAGKTNNKHIKQALLANGALACAHSFGNQLLVAVISGNRAKVRDLLDVAPKSLPQPVCDCNGITMLMYAASNGDNDMVELLVSEATVNGKDNLGNTPLMYAVRNGHIETVKLLLMRGAHIDDQNKDGLSALAYSALYGHVAVFRFLLEQGACIDFVGHTQGVTALHCAVFGGFKEIVELLIDSKAHLESRFDDFPCSSHENVHGTALTLAAYKGFTEIAELLIKHGADVNAIWTENSRSVLSYASDQGHLDIVQLLVEHGALVNYTDGSNLTSFHDAVNSGHLEIAKFLFCNGADINIPQAEDQTPLMNAVIRGYVQLVEQLLAWNAKMNERDQRGMTALTYAIIADQFTCINLLLAAGADCNVQDDNGNTALMYACGKGNKELAQLLVMQGADVTVVNKSGQTAADIAALHNIPDLNEIFTDRFLSF